MTESITSYFHSIFIISLTGVIAEAILSASSNNSKTLESGLKLVFSLCLLLSVVIPAADLLKNAEFPNISEIHEESTITSKEFSIITATKKQMESDISEKIYSEFGIKPQSVCIELVTEEKEDIINVDIKDIVVSLPQEYIEYQNQINIYAKELAGINQKTGGE